MNSIDYANQLVKLFGVAQGEALKALDAETEDRRRNDLCNGRKPSYKQALDAAFDSIRGWLDTGDEYAVKLDWDDIRTFAFSHRKACVWAVLTVKAGKVRK
jgi:hypothetical protein